MQLRSTVMLAPNTKQHDTTPEEGLSDLDKSFLIAKATGAGLAQVHMDLKDAPPEKVESLLAMARDVLRMREQATPPPPEHRRLDAAGNRPTKPRFNDRDIGNLIRCAAGLPGACIR